MTIMGVTENVQVDLSILTLDELTQLASDSLSKGEEALSGALLHFMDWGQILLEVNDRVGRGNFKAWCSENNVNYAWSGKAMRVAFYRDRLPQEAFEPFRTTSGNLLQPGLNTVWRMYVKGLPPISPYGNKRYSEEHIAEAKRLHGQGVDIEGISSILGASAKTVRCWLDPEAARLYEVQRTRKRHESIAARRALEEKRKRSEIDRLARETGGELSKSYGLVRQALATLDRAAAATDAIRHLHKAEEVIVAAMRSERQS